MNLENPRAVCRAQGEPSICTWIFYYKRIFLLLGGGCQHCKHIPSLSTEMFRNKEEKKNHNGS